MFPDLYAVIGDPIDHSLSPIMQAAAFSAAGLHAQYDAIRVTPEELPGTVRRLRTHGFAGFNVTIPHKESIPSHLDSLTALATGVGAANTVIRKGNDFVGDNTDVPGFLAALDTLREFRQRERAIVFGSGGAARAVVHGLVARGLFVTVLSRSRGKKISLPSTDPSMYRILWNAVPEAKSEIEHAQVLINTTPAGMSSLPNASPLPGGVDLDSNMVIMDLVYGRETPFLRRGLEAGCRCMDGLEMLVQQGALAFKIWTDLEPDLDAMRDACRLALLKERACSAS